MGSVLEGEGVVMDTVLFEMPSLVLSQINTSADKFLELMLETELTLFEEGYYKNGPTVVELIPTQFGQEKQDYRFYVPTNEVVEDSERYRWVEKLRVDRALRCRVPFDEGLEVVVGRMRRYARQQGFVGEDRVLLVMTLVYGQYWVDFLLPYQDKK